jgi:hypothetical protein
MHILNRLHWRPLLALALALSLAACGAGRVTVRNADQIAEAAAQANQIARSAPEAGAAAQLARRVDELAADVTVTGSRAEEELSPEVKDALEAVTWSVACHIVTRGFPADEEEIVDLVADAAWDAGMGLVNDEFAEAAADVLLESLESLDTDEEEDQLKEECTNL